MAEYVLIESRDPFESGDVPYFYSLASSLVKNGDKVTLFLVQNGVLASRKNSGGNPLESVLGDGIDVLVDGFSLQERGISDAEKHPSVKLSDIDELVDLMVAEEKTKILWH